MTPGRAGSVSACLFVSEGSHVPSFTPHRPEPPQCGRCWARCGWWKTGYVGGADRPWVLQSAISVILYVDLLKYCYSGHGGLSEIWLKLISFFFIQLLENLKSHVRSTFVACTVLFHGILLKSPCGWTGGAALKRVINGWRRYSPQQGPFWICHPCCWQELLVSSTCGGVWGGGQRWDLTWKPIIAQKTVSPTWASRVGRNRWQGLWPPFCCPLSLPIDLLRNSPIQCPDPPPSPTLSEKQADTFVQQWRHKFALSLNSSWGFFFLYQLLEFFNFSNTVIWKNFELLPLVLCCAMVLCILTCSGTCKLLIYAECLLQCSAL